jgi:hypothetical protein
MTIVQLTKPEVISALAKSPRRDLETVEMIRKLLVGEPFQLISVFESRSGTGLEFYVDKNRLPIEFNPDGPNQTPPIPHKRFSLLISDFDRFLVALSRPNIVESGINHGYSQLDNPCDTVLSSIAETVASSLSLRLVDPFALHDMGMDWEELPKHNETEFVARLDYSEPNAFSLLFYEWD